MQQMRVVYLGHSALLSGGELALANLLPALADVDAHVILADDGPLVDRLRDAGAAVEVLPMSPVAAGVHRDRVGARLPAAAMAETTRYVGRLVRVLRRLRPDLVHTNTLKANLYGGMAARLVGIPQLWHARDRIATDYLPGPAVGLVRSAVRMLPTALVANSQSTLETVPIGRRKLARVIHDPVPEHRRARVPCDQLRVVMVGRLAPWKGQRVFLEAFARAFPDGDVRGRIVGSAMFGEDDYAQDLQTLCDQLGLNERVTFTGFVEDVAGQLADADVLVHASLSPEPFGQVVVEGMSAGLAVIATREGGPGEIVTDGTDGLLVPGGNVAALARALRALADDALLRSRLGTAARDSAGRFLPNTIGPQFVELYHDVLATRSRRSDRSRSTT